MYGCNVAACHASLFYGCSTSDGPSPDLICCSSVLGKRFGILRFTLIKSGRIGRLRMLSGVLGGIERTPSAISASRNVLTHCLIDPVQQAFPAATGTLLIEQTQLETMQRATPNADLRNPIMKRGER